MIAPLTFGQIIRQSQKMYFVATRSPRRYATKEAAHKAVEATRRPSPPLGLGCTKASLYVRAGWEIPPGPCDLMCHIFWYIFLYCIDDCIQARSVVTPRLFTQSARDPPFAPPRAPACDAREDGAGRGARAPEGQPRLMPSGAPTGRTGGVGGGSGRWECSKRVVPMILYMAWQTPSKKMFGQTCLSM